MDWHIWCGDITRLKVDAIVNAANISLQGGAGVDGAIHQVAGTELLYYCQKNFPSGCHTGEARITPGFALPSSYVIHTPGPVWQDCKNNEICLLASCYHSVMVLADIYQCRQIAFPAISTGVYHFPVDLAASIAVKTIKAYAMISGYAPSIILVAFGIHTRCAYEAALHAQQITYSKEIDSNWLNDH